MNNSNCILCTQRVAMVMITILQGWRTSKRSRGAVDGSSLRPTSLHLLCALRFHQSQINSKPHDTTFQCRLNQTWPPRASLMRPTQNPPDNLWTARARRATRGFSAVQSRPHYLCADRARAVSLEFEKVAFAHFCSDGVHTPRGLFEDS